MEGEILGPVDILYLTWHCQDSQDHTLTLLSCSAQQRAHTSSSPLFSTLFAIHLYSLWLGREEKSVPQNSTVQYSTTVLQYFQSATLKLQISFIFGNIFGLMCQFSYKQYCIFARTYFLISEGCPSVYIAPTLWTNNATVIVKMDTWGDIHSTYWARNFSQKLFLFCLSSTEVDRVLDSECSRMSRSLAVCTRVSAVCGHTQMFSPG